MKKILKLCTFIFLILFFTGCNEKKALTGSEFISLMTDKGYEITDIKDDFIEGTFIEAYIASKDEVNIEFYVTESIEQSTTAYQMNKAIYENVEKDSSKDFYEKIKNNFGIFYYTKDDKFKLTSLVEKTYIYVESSNINKKEILNVIKAIGY